MNNGSGVVFFSLTTTSFVVSVSPVRILQSSSKAESSLSSDSPSSVIPRQETPQIRCQLFFWHGHRTTHHHTEWQPILPGMLFQA